MRQASRRHMTEQGSQPVVRQTRETWILNLHSMAMPILPVNAGTYEVVATVNNENYVGGNTATLTIQQATALVTLGNLLQVYDETVKAASSATEPQGLNVNLSYNNIPLNAGSYEVTATVDNPNYVGSATGTLIIQPATATVNLSNLVQVYSGTVKSVSAATLPDGLNVLYSYSDTPVNVGTYDVTATVDNPNYIGSATGVLTINPATAGSVLRTLCRYMMEPLSQFWLLRNRRFKCNINLQ